MATHEQAQPALALGDTQEALPPHRKVRWRVCTRCGSVVNPASSRCGWCGQRTPTGRARRKRERVGSDE